MSCSIFNFVYLLASLLIIKKIIYIHFWTKTQSLCEMIDKACRLNNNVIKLELTVLLRYYFFYLNSTMNTPPPFFFVSEVLIFTHSAVILKLLNLFYVTVDADFAFCLSASPVFQSPALRGWRSTERN